MNLQDLIYFKHLAESLSFTETAKHFYVSQPSISAAIQRLENKLVTVLVDRRKTLKQIQLTTAGEILYEDTIKVLELLETTQQKIQNLGQENVYYGFLPTIGGYFLPKLMPHLADYHQTIQFIEEESSDIMLKNVLEEKVPIAIIGHEKPHIQEKNLQEIPIFVEEMALWMAPTHPLAQKKVLETKDLQNEVFISLSEGYTHQRIFDQWARINKIPEPNILYTKEIKTAQSIAASTQMLAFMADIIVDEHTPLVKVPLKNAPKFYIRLILNTAMENSLVQEAFNEAVIAAVRKEFIESI